MSKSRNNGIARITLLVLLQWISIAIIILNACALSTSSEASKGLIAARPGPQDILLVILGAVSLLASSLLLCLHIHVFSQLIGNRPYAPSKAILGMEMGVGIIMIGLWAFATSLILTNVQVSSACGNSESMEHHEQACNLFNNAIILAFVATAGWLLIILTALYTFNRSTMQDSATIFTVECYTKEAPSTYTIDLDGNMTSTIRSTASQQRPAIPAAILSKSDYYDYDTPISYDESRGAVKSWCSEYSTASILTLNSRMALEPVSLGDLPRIQEGMSCLDLTFGAQPYEEKKTNFYPY